VQTGAETGASKIASTLVEVEGYKDLAQPVILTSGELGVYYINTEKLAQDAGKWQEYAQDSQAMIRHCVSQMQSKPSYAEVIQIIAEQVAGLFPEGTPSARRLISGGQRRDWLFSGPVAKVLNLPHVSLHKDGSAFLLTPDLQTSTPLASDSGALQGFSAVHISDLLTKGSSAFNPKVDPPTGWIVSLRELGADISELVTVVTRLQGGEEILADVDVRVTSFVTIDTNFIEEHSDNKENALQYLNDPQAWSENYIRAVGISAFVDTFDPNSSKIDRARKFLKVYDKVLTESGRLQELQSEVSDRFGENI